MNSAPLLLLLHQTLQPIKNPKLTLAAHNSTPGARKSTPTYITACAKTTRKTGGERRKNPDDYHATLTALNSKGRFPRKSLGQIFSISPNKKLSLFSRFCVLFFVGKVRELHVGLGGQ